MQKRAPAGNSVPQLEQRCASAVPQLRQNLAFAGFSVWQLGHFILHLLSGSMRPDHSTPPCARYSNTAATGGKLRQTAHSKMEARLGTVQELSNLRLGQVGSPQIRRTGVVSDKHDYFGGLQPKRLGLIEVARRRF
jgi:hypothetical protein